MRVNDRIFFVMMVVMALLLAGAGFTIAAHSDVKHTFDQFSFISGITDQMSKENNYDYNNYDNYIRVSTGEDGEKKDGGGSQYICNKLLETCNLPPATETPSTETPSTETDSSKSKSEEILKKYFEQDGAEVPATPPTSNEVGSSVVTEGNATTPKSAEIDFQVYDSPTLGIRMLYPVGWEEKEENTERYSESVFLSPPENSTDQVRERLVVRINNQPTNLTLDDYSERIIKSLQNSTDFRIINSSSTVLSDYPAYMLSGVARQGGKDLNLTDEWMIKEGKAYRIVFYSEVGKSPIYLPIAQKMIDSFRITK